MEEINVNKFCLFFLTIFPSVLIGGGYSFAMASTHIHFVDESYQGKTIKGQPNGELGTRWNYKNGDINMMINYPEDHRVEKWPLKQYFSFAVYSYEKKGSFLLKKVDLFGANGESIKLFTINSDAVINGSEYFPKSFSLNDSISFFCDIPENINRLTLAFEVEVVLESGNKEIISKQISLKRAKYKVSSWEGLNY